MRIGATLILLMILYVSAYGLLRATHVLIRIGPGYRLVSAPVDASSPTTLEYGPGYVDVSGRHDHVAFLAPLYAPLGHLEVWARGLFEPR